MTITDWKYYNHAAIPNVAPHKCPDLSLVESGKIYKKSVLGGGQCCLAGGQLIGIVKKKQLGGM